VPAAPAAPSLPKGTEKNMANKSNRELAEEAFALGARLGRAVETEGLKNSQLVELVAELQAAADALPPTSRTVDGNDVGTAGGVPAGRPLDPPPATLDRPEAISRLVNGDGVDALGGAPKPAAPTGPVIRYPYVVAEGKMVTTLRGPKGAFDPIGASDFKGGQEALDTLVDQGFVTKR
jgi:hypothetical protein